MAIMSFNKSSKSIMSAINYFESDTDHTNTVRKFKPIAIFSDKNNIEKIENLARESGIENTHTSLTISFRDSEFSELKNPNGSYNEEKLVVAMKEIVKDFRETWFPGLKNPDNFSDFWNIHTDKGNIELNCAFVKMEISTGKSFNPFPPGELNQDMRDNYVDLLNDKLGFDRVIRNPFAISHNELELKDIQNPSETVKRLQNFVKPKKDKIQSFLTAQVLDNKINSREQLIKVLQKNGEVKFLDKENEKDKYNYISFIPTGSKKAMKLSGPMFKKNANFDELRNEHRNNQYTEKDDSLKHLSNEEREAKQGKLSKHIDIQKNCNEKLKNSGIKKIKKNSTRKYLPKSKKIATKKATSSNEKVAQKNQSTERKNDNAKAVDATKEIKKVTENKARTEEKKSSQSSSQIRIKSITKNKEESSKSSKASISSFSAVAFNSSSALITVQINSILFSKLNLEMQMSQLNHFKVSDIKKIFEIKQKIAELQQQIETLKAKQEQSAESALIANANKFKNSSSKLHI